MAKLLSVFFRLFLLVIFVCGIFLFTIYTIKYRNIRDIVIYISSHIYPFEQNKINSKHYSNIVQKYAKDNSALEGGLTVFVGDSYVNKFDFNIHLLNCNSIVNRGIDGDTTIGLLLRLDKNVNDIQPRNVFLMVGYNDIRFRNVDDILNNYIKILKNISAKNIFVFSLLPVHKDRSWVNKRINSLNCEIKKISVQEGAEYIDLYSSFVNPETGGIFDDYTSEGTHLTPSGYLLWTNVLRSFLQRIENDITEN